MALLAMRAALWIVRDSIRWKEIDVPCGAGVLSKPSRMICCPVRVAVTPITDIPKRALVAEFELFDMRGWYPSVIAHYVLHNRPPKGWEWIIHPATNLLLLLQTTV